MTRKSVLRMETKNPLVYGLSLIIKIVVAALGLAAAFISINVQHEFYTIFTYGNIAGAFFVAFVMVSFSIFFFEYWQFLKIRHEELEDAGAEFKILAHVKNRSNLVFYLFIASILFIGIGTFSGAYTLTQKSKLSQKKEVVLDDKTRVKWNDIKDREKSKNEEIVKEEKKRDRIENLLAGLTDEKLLKKYGNEINNYDETIRRYKREWENIKKEKTEFLNQNKTVDLSENADLANKDVFEFIGGIFGDKTGAVAKGLIMFLIVLLFDLASPFVLSIAIFYFNPVLVKENGKQAEIDDDGPSRKIRLEYRIEEKGLKSIPEKTEVNRIEKETENTPDHTSEYLKNERRKNPYQRFVDNIEEVKRYSSAMFYPGPENKPMFYLRNNIEVCKEIKIPPEVGDFLRYEIIAKINTKNGPMIQTIENEDVSMVSNRKIMVAILLSYDKAKSFLLLNQ